MERGEGGGELKFCETKNDSRVQDTSKQDGDEQEEEDEKEDASSLESAAMMASNRLMLWKEKRISTKNSKNSTFHGSGDGGGGVERGGGEGTRGKETHHVLTPGYFLQLSLLSSRSYKRLFRKPTLLRLHFVVTLIFSLIICMLWSELNKQTDFER